MAAWDWSTCPAHVWFRAGGGWHAPRGPARSAGPPLGERLLVGCRLALRRLQPGLQSVGLFGVPASAACDGQCHGGIQQAGARADQLLCQVAACDLLVGVGHGRSTAMPDKAQMPRQPHRARPLRCLARAVGRLGQQGGGPHQRVGMTEGVIQDGQGLDLQGAVLALLLVLAVRVRRDRQASRLGAATQDGYPRDCNRLGLFDTCPRGMPVVRTTPSRGQVLNKPRGRKPRRTWRCRSKLWRLQACGSAAIPTLIDAQARCDGTRGRDGA